MQVEIQDQHYAGLCKSMLVRAKASANKAAASCVGEVPAFSGDEGGDFFFAFFDGDEPGR